MPGLVPGIHEFLWGSGQVVDGRDKPGHDGKGGAGGGDGSVGAKEEPGLPPHPSALTAPLSISISRMSFFGTLP